MIYSNRKAEKKIIIPTFFSYISQQDYTHKGASKISWNADLSFNSAFQALFEVPLYNYAFYHLYEIT